MSHEIRACSPQDIRLAATLKGNKFLGLFATPLNGLIDYIQAGNNLTLHFESKNAGIGEFNNETGMYDGCIGRLQRNQSDLIFSLLDYPINAENINQGDIGYSQAIQLFGLYYPRTEGELSSVRVESCFKSFSHEVWFLCVSTALIVYLFLQIRRNMYLDFEREFRHILSSKKKRSKKRSLLRENRPVDISFVNMIAHMTRFGSIEDTDGRFIKIIYITLSFFSLLVIHYFCSFIKTELVTVPAPETYESYQDLIDNDVSLFFVEGFDHYKEFKFAPEKSAEKILWDRSIRNKSEEDVVLSTELNNEEMLDEYAKLFVTRKLMPVIDSYLVAIIRTVYCQVAFDKAKEKMARERFKKAFADDKLPSPYPKILQDEGIKISIKGAVYSSFFKGEAFSIIRFRLKSIFETGIGLKTISLIIENNVLKDSPLAATTTKIAPEDYYEIRLCKEGTIKQPDIHLSGIKFANIKYFVGLMVFFLTISFLCLLLEMCSGNATKLHKIQPCS